MPHFRIVFFCLVAALCALCFGCAQTVNPSFPTTIDQANAELNRIADAPKKLDRPLVIIGGFVDPGVAPMMMSWMFKTLSADDRIISVPMGIQGSFDICREKAIAAVEQKFPCKDPTQTVEVDVIGMSMGGLVARYAALPKTGVKRLRIVRLFTVSSPLQGADSASRYPALLPLMEPMRAGSPFLKELNTQLPDYAVYSYVRLSDLPVGVHNASLPGCTPWWVFTPPLNDPHNGSFSDPRILADIARRLRGETPLSKDPPTPLPDKS